MLRLEGVCFDACVPPPRDSIQGGGQPDKGALFGIDWARKAGEGGMRWTRRAGRLRLGVLRTGGGAPPRANPLLLSPSRQIDERLYAACAREPRPSTPEPPGGGASSPCPITRLALGTQPIEKSTPVQSGARSHSAPVAPWPPQGVRMLGLGQRSRKLKRLVRRHAYTEAPSAGTGWARSRHGAEPKLTFESSFGCWDCALFLSQSRSIGGCPSRAQAGGKRRRCTTWK